MQCSKDQCARCLLTEAQPLGVQKPGESVSSSFLRQLSWERLCLPAHQAPGLFAGRCAARERGLSQWQRKGDGICISFKLSLLLVLLQGALAGRAELLQYPTNRCLRLGSSCGATCLQPPALWEVSSTSSRWTAVCVLVWQARPTSIPTVTVRRDRLTQPTRVRKSFCFNFCLSQHPCGSCSCPLWRAYTGGEFSF